MTWAARSQPIQVGDRVAVSARYLRQTAQHTGPICFARGVVTELKPLGELTIATISWDGSPAEVPERMGVNNLSRITAKGILDHD